MKRLLLLIAVLFLIGVASAAWVNVNTTAGWLPRFYHSSVALSDGSIILMGGNDGLGNETNDVWKSTDDGATWTFVGYAGWSAREQSTAVVLPDDSIVLMGGETGIGLDGGVLNETWRSVDGGASWTEMNASSGWAKRGLASSVAMPDGSIVIMGGDGHFVPYNDVWRSTDNGATWTQVNASAGWSARYGQSVVKYYSDIVLMGGFTGALLKNDTWLSTDNGYTWTLINADPGWQSRQQQSSFVLPGDRIVLIGGVGAPDNDEWLSTDEGVTWNFVSAAPWGYQLWGQSSAVNPYDGKAVVTGGYTAYSVWNNNFLPVINSISPTNGTASGGTLVNITGSGFTGAGSVYLSVSFGATPGVNNVEISDSEMSSVSPPGTGTVDITVMSPWGTSSPTANGSFTYIPIPTPTTQPPPSQNTWWTPHTVQVNVMDANYGTRLYDVNIQAHYNESSMPTGWINTLYGIGSSVQTDMVNKSLIMVGTTGSEGTVTFTMLGSIKYDIALTAAQYGLSNYKVMAYPSDNMLNIYVPTAGSTLPTQLNNTYNNLNGTRVYFTEPDLNNVSMCIDYIDKSGETSSVTFLWQFANNGTQFNTTTLNPGTGLNTICNVTRNIKGTQIYWGYNATRNPVTV